MSRPIRNIDCITCANKGTSVEAVFGDGTGRCGAAPTRTVKATTREVKKTCEPDPAEKCSGTKCDGYRGKQNVTKSGRTCQAWD